MKQLFTAIMTDFNTGNTFNTAIGGRLYAGRVPAQISYPYCIFDLITAIPTYYLDTETVEDLTIQFTIVANTTDVSDVNDIQDKLRSWFDNIKLTVTGYNYINTSLSNYILTQPDEEMNIFNYIVDYDIMMSKT